MSDLEFLFHPRSIAIVGAPSDSGATTSGGFYLDSLIKFGNNGNVYPVNPRANEILGLKAYPDIKSLPQPPDYVICCLPAPRIPQLIKECAEIRVKVVSIYTAGFSESDEAGKKAEQEIVQLARQGGVRLIGPNCMGIYCPSTGLTYSPDFSHESGSVAFLCQSGGNSNELVERGSFRGVRYSKVVSYGNAADLNEADFIEYLGQDIETRIIGLYIEGAKEGQRFFKALRQVTREKPVILLKGGRTDAGMKAVTSHTGALSGSNENWDVLCRQTGVIQVYSLEEMIDLFVTFLCLKPLTGRRVGIVGYGGGSSVLATDACEDAGLVIPTFSHQVRQELSRFSGGVGSIVRNPIDTSAIHSPQLLDIVKIIDSSHEIDLLFMMLHGFFSAWPDADKKKERWLENVIEIKQSIDIPMAVVMRSGDTLQSSVVFSKFCQRCQEAGLVLYPAMDRAARALNRFVQYHVWKNS